MWGDYENETLIHNHKIAKVYKKRYQRAGYFNNVLYNLFGIITIISSSIASTISWSITIDYESLFILSTIITISAISSVTQNFCNFKETSNICFKTAKVYAKIQNKIECVGNIHPEYRTTEPVVFFKKVQNSFNLISDNRNEISNCMVKYFYNKKNDDSSYLEDKHEIYKSLNDKDKLTFAKNIDSDLSEDEDEGEDNDILDLNIS